MLLPSAPDEEPEEHRQLVKIIKIQMMNVVIVEIFMTILDYEANFAQTKRPTKDFAGRCMKPCFDV